MVRTNGLELTANFKLMKRVTLAYIFIILSTGSLISQNRFETDNINDSLKTNANAVLRFYNTVYNRVSLGKYNVNVHYAITILNRNGKNDGELVIHYDRNSTISGIQGCLYNKHGIKLKKIKKKEISDFVANNDYTMYSDHRVKAYSPTYSTYPYTVEYQYSIDSKAIAGFDPWRPQMQFNTSVENAILTFNTPENLDIKYLELNHNFIPKENLVDGIKTYRWSVTNLQALEYERHAPNILDYMPTILLSPNKTVYENCEGDFSSWNSYGKWSYQLIENRDQLPEETAQYMISITDTLPTKRDKIKAVYKYMQSKTRYVNIALGIGGFQPQKASDVDKLGYGDCKALTNYTKALLKCIGIRAYYTEIGSGNYQEIKFPEFASANQTNHIILCVPNDRDTIWLECTSQNMPAGYLGSSCLNRYALLIKPDGGELVKTPKFSADNNLRASNIEIEIADNGDADFKLSSTHKNYQFEDIFGLVLSSKKEQKEALLRYMPVEGINITNYSIEKAKRDKAQATIELEGHIKQYATKSSNRLFIKPVYFLRGRLQNSLDEDRKQNLYQSQALSFIDTLCLNIPSAYSIECLPDSAKYSSIYGSYSINYKKQPNKIIITRETRINQGNYTSKHFKKIDFFLRNVDANKKRRIILSRKKTNL